jgi:hypothetical protein
VVASILTEKIVPRFLEVPKESWDHLLRSSAMEHATKIARNEHIRSIHQDYAGHIFGALSIRRGFWPCVMDHPHEWLA